MYVLRRVAFVLFLAIALSSLPWYVFAIASIAFVALHRTPVEAVVLAVYADVAYGATVWLWGVPPFLTLSIVAYAAAAYARTHLRPMAHDVV